MQLPNLRKYPVITRVVVVLVLAVLSLMAYRAYGWPGIALGLGALVMWMLLHMTRLLLVLRRTAQRPVGTLDSAVMLRARLAPGMTLLQVLALTRSLGQRDGPADSEPEHYRWTDGGGARVHCTFEHGKLAHWELLRP